ncbi:DUF6157 family protein [Sphaerisporangium rubeum]|uniref:Uncharacterized protein n=1 Tax=Sphaerisporangium rubeum TaxID=321317 RepID=A0A7X0M7D3_9ACTN|nr:DUF6157 family protein [Sphaerisporangium rubeum]MBB6474425.1 hypothetical protein [Sphaerisporangium rubeum]
MNLNYYATLIAVADDCPVERAEVPAPRGGKPTVATVQYAMLTGGPGELTQEDVLFETWLRRQDPPADAADVPALRDAFFSRSQACLRASPLPKRHGFGLLFDDEGRVRLCPMESDEYRRIVSGDVPGVTVLKAMRTRRA